MNDAWAEGALTVAFNGIAQTAFQTNIEAAAQANCEVGDIEAQLNMKRDQGVARNPDFGNDSLLYGAMGFKRKSERASGLTRKTKPQS